MTQVTQLRINGALYPIPEDSDPSLLSFLREDLGMTGTKYGCGEGQCGACTVLLDGRMTSIVPDPRERRGGPEHHHDRRRGAQWKLHPLQQAFLDTEAMQCGYCTSACHVRPGPAPPEPEPHRRGDHPRHGRQSLPLRDLPAHSPGDPSRCRFPEGGPK